MVLTQQGGRGAVGAGTMAVVAALLMAALGIWQWRSYAPPSGAGAGGGGTSSTAKIAMDSGVGEDGSPGRPPAGPALVDRELDGGAPMGTRGE